MKEKPMLRYRAGWSAWRDWVRDQAPSVLRDIKLEIAADLTADEAPMPVTYQDASIDAVIEDALKTGARKSKEHQG